jgi:two-component system chemotaxis sensor kinase CheA
VAQNAVKPQEVLEALKIQQAQGHSSSEPSIRVDVNLLEKQKSLVSEVVLLRNRLLQIAAEANERNLNSTAHSLNYVTSELRKKVMKTRMQPVSQLYDKVPRRDLSKEVGKRVRLETQGGETELDKSLLEAIKDPVTHILRNSIDHGIEVPEKRRPKGKPEEGTIHVRAFHEGGNFHWEIADDGAGIDVARVKEKALAKGQVTAAQAEKMTENEILNLIFLPGLWTAEKVTNVSGCGVGMDVVKTNIERIGERAKLESVANQGTAVRLEIPLTLATIPALTVLSGKSVFAIPQAALVEMVGLDAEAAQKLIQRIEGTSVIPFRNTVVPLMSLREELRLEEWSVCGMTTRIRSRR